MIATFETARSEMSALIAHWIEAGLVPAGRGMPEQPAWELLVPAAFVRLPYLHADADEATLLADRERVLDHAEFFIATVLAMPRAEKGDDDV